MFFRLSLSFFLYNNARGVRMWNMRCDNAAKQGPGVAQGSGRTVNSFGSTNKNTKNRGLSQHSQHSSVFFLL